MRVEPRQIAGVRLVETQEHLDDRGSFRKLWDATREAMTVDQICISENRVAGTVRGLHLQVAPHGEIKSLWCSGGAVWDVLVDLRPDEPTYGCWAAVELNAMHPQILHLPRGVAHGFQSLVDASAITYVISGEHHPASARTLPWNDPRLSLPWPLAVTSMSDSDRTAAPWAW